MLKIDFNRENIEKCLCTDCPVHKGNNCIEDQVKLMEEISKDLDIDTGIMIGPDELPKLYCATGKTKCTDLNTHEECQCPQCEVWKENDLEVRDALAYFCVNGRAVECCKITIDEEDFDNKSREMRRTYYTPI
jgi:hypothetical protein